MFRRQRRGDDREVVGNFGVIENSFVRLHPFAP
jgi:hypothetical protein